MQSTPVEIAGCPEGASALPWQRELARAVRDPDELCDLLELPESLRAGMRRAASLFGLLVPRGYLARMECSNPHDPLLLQVLPVAEENRAAAGFVADPVGDRHAERAAGLLQKYQGRVLLVTTGACAVHCRYCFRRHYPYWEAPHGLEEWEPALAELARDRSIREVILSGGDPLVMTDAWLARLAERLDRIDHLRRLRIHTRLPIVLPERVDDRLLAWLAGCRLQPIVVVHANHPRELDRTCGAALARLVDAGILVLNQAVLLAGVNDDAEVLAELCERLVALRVLPYYLHQLDRVAGAAHFEVPVERGLALLAELRRRLPGYALPRYVCEVAGEPSKIELGSPFAEGDHDPVECAPSRGPHCVPGPAG